MKEIFLEKDTLDDEIFVELSSIPVKFTNEDPSKGENKYKYRY